MRAGPNDQESAKMVKLEPTPKKTKKRDEFPCINKLKACCGNPIK